jgi:glucose/arabinose dehydrogenase
MTPRPDTRIALSALLAALACGHASLPVSAGTGPNPTIPRPSTSLIPVVKIAEAKGWKAGKSPAAGSGLSVVAFATHLEHPRSLLVLPNGDVLVAETNGPALAEDQPTGLRGWFMKRFFKAAGAAVPSANRITLLRDSDGDGVAEVRSILLDSLYSPFGMALMNGMLYVANADALVRFPYRDGDLRITAPATKVTDLPGRPYNHHWTKSLIASRDGTKLYVGVGSNSNVAEHGMDAERDRAAIWEIDVKTGAHRMFASGLRNPAALAWEPATGRLWAAVNERDDLGSDLVPDYMTSVQENGFYGWPYSYFGSHIDKRVKPQRPDLVAKAIVPDYALGPHTGSLGLVSSGGASFPAPYTNGMFVGQHGSWNRNPRSGYKVIFVPFLNGRPSGNPIDVLTGFVKGDRANGRPVGLAMNRRGELLVADDVGNTVWLVRARGATQARR